MQDYGFLEVATAEFPSVKTGNTTDINGVVFDI